MTIYERACECVEVYERLQDGLQEEHLSNFHSLMDGCTSLKERLEVRTAFGSTLPDVEWRDVPASLDEVLHNYCCYYCMNQGTYVNFGNLLYDLSRLVHDDEEIRFMELSKDKATELLEELATYPYSGMVWDW